MSTGNRKTTAAACVELLWRENFFRKGRTLQEVNKRINAKWGHNFSPADISKALSKPKFLRRTGRRGSYQYLQKINPMSKKVTDAGNDLFSETLTKKLNGKFETELNDLRLNFGYSGTCTAFLLRKILEKLLYIVFTQNNIAQKIKDRNNPGGLVGLEKMVAIAAKEKFEGAPIITSQTARRIRGIKFLGDVSAHNPLINVDMETITPQMPFIITAYKELAERLK